MAWRPFFRILLAGAVLAAAGSALAGFPDKPVKLINPYPAGAGAMDVAARVMAEKMTARLGQPVVVNNQDYFGASSALGFSKLLNKGWKRPPWKRSPIPKPRTRSAAPASE